MTTPVRFAKDHYAGGQPTPAHLAALKREGVRTVINLRAPGEAVEYDEAAEAARLGLRYVVLPIAGAADLDRERVQLFGRVLDEARREGGVLIHCASANRAGAMVALDGLFNRDQALEHALAQGRAAGLASLEAAVHAIAGREASR